MIFTTEAEAKKHGADMQGNPDNNIRRYFTGPVVDTCDNITGWTVDFVYEN